MNPDIIKALLDAKVDEITRLANWFHRKTNMKNHPAVFNILELRKWLCFAEQPEKMKVDSHFIGLGNTMTDLLHMGGEEGQIMYQKINEAKVFCDILYIQN